MKVDSELHIQLPQQFSGAIIVGVNCKACSVLGLQSHPSTQYLTSQEVAWLLSVDIRTVRKYARKGKLRAYRYGHRVFFKLHELVNVITH